MPKNDNKDIQNIMHRLKKLEEKFSLLEETVNSLVKVPAIKMEIERDAQFIKSSEIRTSIMLNMNGRSAQEIADLIGKSVSHVRKEMSILKNKSVFPYYTTQREGAKTVYVLTPFGEVLVQHLRASSSLDEYSKDGKEGSEE